MNYWWDTRAYQQSNKVSPFSAAVCVPLALVMITLVARLAAFTSSVKSDDRYDRLNPALLSGPHHHQKDDD